MKSEIYNIESKKIGDLTLNKSIFDTDYSSDLIAQAIRVYLFNQRSSYAKTKTRSEVAGTRKKVWSQKGTGNARHGNRTAPIFVGGGSALGPDGHQNYTLKMGKKMKEKQADNAVSLVPGAKRPKPIRQFFMPGTGTVVSATCAQEAVSEQVKKRGK